MRLSGSREKRDPPLEYVVKLAKDTVDVDIMAPEYQRTSAERPQNRWVHQQMVGALDLLNAYTTKRRASVAGFRIRKEYTSDARTRGVELLKRYLITHLQVEQLDVADLTRHKAFAHGLALARDVFPSRNQCSFTMTMAEVYELLDDLHFELLRRSQTCLLLLQKVLLLGRNMQADVLVYLLLCATDLPIENVRSLEPLLLERELAPGGRLGAHRGLLVVQLLRSLLEHASPLFSDAREAREDLRARRAIAARQHQLALEQQMQEQKQKPKRKGSFFGRKREASPSPDPVLSSLRAEPGNFGDLLEQARAALADRNWAALGFVGALRNEAHIPLFEEFFLALEHTHALAFFLGSVLVEFGEVGKIFGDYGAIASSKVLHPVLTQLRDLGMNLRATLCSVEEKINDALVINPAKERRGSFGGFHSGSALRSSSVEQRRQSRSRIERAVLGERAHVADFLETIEQLRQQSAAERLPRLRDEAQQVVGRLQTVFNSPYFKQLANQDLQEAAGRVFEAGAPLAASLASANVRAIADEPQGGLELQFTVEEFDELCEEGTVRCAKSCPTGGAVTAVAELSSSWAGRSRSPSPAPKRTFSRRDSLAWTLERSRSPAPGRRSVSQPVTRAATREVEPITGVCVVEFSAPLRRAEADLLKLKICEAFERGAALDGLPQERVLLRQSLPRAWRKDEVRNFKCEVQLGSRRLAVLEQLARCAPDVTVTLEPQLEHFKVLPAARMLEWPGSDLPAEEVSESVSCPRNVRPPLAPRRARSLSPRMPQRRAQESDASWVSASTESMLSSSSDAPSRAHTQPETAPRVSPRSTCSTTPPPASPRAAHHSWHGEPVDEDEAPRGTKHWLVTRVARHFSLPFRKDARSDSSGRSTDCLLRPEEKRARKVTLPFKYAHDQRRLEIREAEVSFSSTRSLAFASSAALLIFCPNSAAAVKQEVPLEEVRAALVPSDKAATEVEVAARGKRYFFRFASAIEAAEFLDCVARQR